jgi:hypothetical protein
MTFDPEAIDLLDLTRRLTRELSSEVLPGDYLEGKTKLREVLVSLLDCSELSAEELVDTLVAQGFLRFRSTPEWGGGWYLQPNG